LIWSISVQPEYIDIKIPKLIIQPLVENAIIHGIEKKRKQGAVFIHVEKVDDSSNITITVKDNGSGMEAEMLSQINHAIEMDGESSIKGMGMALTNVNKRIRLYYDQYNLKHLYLDSEQGEGTKVTFEIPELRR
jgi:two-component system, sensor histidine kinase YesM